MPALALEASTLARTSLVVSALSCTEDCSKGRKTPEVDAGVEGRSHAAKTTNRQASAGSVKRFIRGAELEVLYQPHKAPLCFVANLIQCKSCTVFYATFVVALTGASYMELCVHWLRHK